MPFCGFCGRFSIDGESHHRSPRRNDFSKTLYFRFAATLLRVLMAMVLMLVLEHNALIRQKQKGGMMRVNIFEGARRIALLIGGLWAVGWISYAIFEEPYSPVIYVVPWVGTPPLLVEKGATCPRDDADEYFKRIAPDEQEVTVLLCFSAHESDTGAMLIPYADAGERGAWMGEKYSAEVSKYTQSVANNFQPTQEVIDAFESNRRKALLKQWGTAAMFLLGGLAAGWAFVAATGWIVRGFMGIPRGKDMRPIL